MKNKAIFAGTFDPITKGHIDIIKRSAQMFDLTIVIATNVNKKTMFDLETRMNLIKKQLDYEKINANVETTSDLLINYAKEQHIKILIRGLRNSNDYIYEQNLEFNNKNLENQFETIYLSTDQSNLHISSSMVREILKFNGDITNYVPNEIICEIKEYYENL